MTKNNSYDHTSPCGETDGTMAVRSGVRFGQADLTFSSGTSLGSLPHSSMGRLEVIVVERFS
jgi:hypothetical protein